MEETTEELAIYVLRWLDRNDLSMTNLREMMDSMANYNRTLEEARDRQKERQYQHGDTYE